MPGIQDLLERLETERGSKLISYLTGDRKPFTTQIASDVIYLFQQHLEAIGEQEKISLLLYTRGGDMIAPLRLVKLLREYCKRLEVLVPYVSHSAGTLLCLGADQIVMGRLSELSPVDPSMTHPFNPSNPLNPQEKLQISVEDLNSYFLFATDKVGVKKSQLAELYKSLVQQVHPLALGSAYRAQRMAKMIATRSLSLHLKDRKKIERIVQELTSDLCVHGYPITRDEAYALGLPIENASNGLDKQMHELFDEYANILELKKAFLPNELLQGAESVEIENTAGIIHSKAMQHRYVYKAKIKRDGNGQIALNIDSNKWELYNK